MEKRHLNHGKIVRYIFCKMRGIGTLSARSTVTTTTILILGDSAEQVSELAADAMAQRPILDDFFAVDHQKPGIFQASLDLPQYGFNNFSETGDLIW